MSIKRSLITVAAALAVTATACSTTLGSGITTSTQAEDPAAPPTTPAAALPGAAVDDETTTTTVFDRLVPVPAEPPAWNTVTLTTPDEIDLHAKFWPGGPTAVIVSHDFGAITAGTGQRPPQSSESVLIWSGIVANAGHTVLSVDWRGHGQSEGEYSVKLSQLDLKTAYEYLTDQGYQTIVALAFVGAGPVVVDLEATDPGVAFDGIGLLWATPQETGFDATSALPEVDAPVWLVGIDTPRSVRRVKLLAPKVNDLYESFIFPPVPNGVQFIDVYGEEFGGRLLDFIESA